MNILYQTVRVYLISLDCSKSFCLREQKAGKNLNLNLNDRIDSSQFEHINNAAVEVKLCSW